MNKYIIKILLATFVIVSFVSCLKDKSYDEHKTGHNLDDVPRVIELGFKNKLNHDQSISLDLKDKDTVLNFLTVRLAANDPAPENITVVIDTSVTAELINAYNAANGTSIVKFSDNFFSFPEGLTVSIPAGQREGYLKIKTNSIDFDPAETYALGFKIASVAPGGYTASQNFGTFLSIIGAKNKYDGIYNCDFSNYHPSANPGYTGEITEVHMVTTGPNTVKLFWPLAGDFRNPSILNGGFSFFGSQSPEYTIDNGTNKVTVQNAYPGAITFYTMNNSFDSKYDPDAKKIYVKWGYSYGVPGVFDATCREWTQTFTYVKPR